MPRGRSRSSSRTRSSYTATRPMPQQTRTTQLPTQQTAQKGGFFSGVASTIMHGMAFGAGS